MDFLLRIGLVCVKCTYHTKRLDKNISALTSQKIPFLYCSFQLLSCKHVSLWNYYLLTAVVWLLSRQSLPSNGSTSRIIIFSILVIYYFNVIPLSSNLSYMEYICKSTLMLSIHFCLPLYIP
jgi:hypothetical protein